MNLRYPTNKMNTKNIRLKRVTISDVDFLYLLLKDRDQYTNISHKKMPTFLQHKKFVKSNHYSYWYVIFSNNVKIGAAYMTNINEIGLHLKKEFQNLGIEKSILNKLLLKHPRSRYIINVNPKNKKRVQFLKKTGFSLIQHTYELITDRK